MGHEHENHGQNMMQDTRYTPNPTPDTSFEDIRVGPAQNPYWCTPPSEYEQDQRSQKVAHKRDNCVKMEQV